jgi:hypothetical protein
VPDKALVERGEDVKALGGRYEKRFWKSSSWCASMQRRTTAARVASSISDVRIVRSCSEFPTGFISLPI